MANYQEISFPEGWFNTYPQTPPKKTQQIPKKSQTTNRPDQLPDIVHKLIHLLLQVWSRLSLAISNNDGNEHKVIIKRQTNRPTKTKVLKELILRRNVPFVMVLIPI